MNILSKFQLSESVNQLMSDEAVYRTAPATPGLLIIFSLCHGFNLYRFVGKTVKYHLCRLLGVGNGSKVATARYSPTLG